MPRPGLRPSAVDCSKCNGMSVDVFLLVWKLPWRPPEARIGRYWRREDKRLLRDLGFGVDCWQSILIPSAIPPSSVAVVWEIEHGPAPDDPDVACGG